MGSVGDGYDNALCESFFATFERELLGRTTFRTASETRLAVFDWIEAGYNPYRRHSGTWRMSPANFERRYAYQTLAASINLFGKTDCLHSRSKDQRGQSHYHCGHDCVMD